MGNLRIKLALSLICALILACGQSAPNDAFLVSAAEQALGLLNNPKAFLVKAAKEQLPDKESFSAKVNRCKVLKCEYDGSHIVRRGKLFKSKRGAEQKFIVRISGRVTLRFLHTPSVNWNENQTIQRDVVVDTEKEFEAYTDDYGEWKVRY